MPGVVFLKYLKITATGTDSQGKFEYAECVKMEKAQCLHCRCTELYRHGYFRRMLSDKGRDDARKGLRLKRGKPPKK